jgi:hypothetical protein
MAVIASFGLTPDDPDFHFANDGVLAPEWTEQAELIAGSFTFAVVRNPWDRFVSGWQYCRSTRDRSVADVLRRPPKSGHDFRHLTRPQCATLYGPDGRLAVDHVIRFEDLDRGFAEVAERVGLSQRTVERVNEGRRPDYREVFDAKARKLFERRFGGDIDRLGYSF